VRIELETPVKPAVVKATMQPQPPMPATPPPLPPVAQTAQATSKPKAWWKFWE
jgi:hypothetical protein